MTRITETVTLSWPDRIGNLMNGWVTRLPYGRAHCIPHDLVGYVILGLVTLSSICSCSCSSTGARPYRWVWQCWWPT